jgi:deazaflavin-dependent oxidoreductase (nitroreductase family)
MPAPRWMARVNRRVTNRVLGRLATRAPGFGVIVHRGRRSGRAYRTPVNVFTAPAGFVVALTYGTGAGWVRNVMAAGGCALETRGRRLVLGAPRLVHDESRRLVPAPVGRVLRLLRVADFLELSLVADRTPPTRVPSWVPLFNRVARRLLAAGVPMGPTALVTVRGRVSGLPRTTPLSIVEASGRRWLIGPFGEVDWVRNLRAAGRATITARGRTEEVTAVELTPAEAVGFVRDVLAPRARRTRAAAWIVRHVDGIDVENPVEAARGRPVFELHGV